MNAFARFALAACAIGANACAVPIRCEPARARSTCPHDLVCNAEGLCVDPSDPSAPAPDGAAPHGTSDGELHGAAEILEVDDTYECVVLPNLDATTIATRGDHVLFAATNGSDALFVDVGPTDLNIEVIGVGQGDAVPAFTLDDAGHPWIAVLDTAHQEVRLLEGQVDGAFDEHATLELAGYTDIDVRAGDRPGLANMGVFTQLALSGHASGVSVFSFDGGTWGRDTVLGAEEGAGPDARIVVEGATQWVAWKSLQTTFLSDGLGASWFTRQDGREQPVFERPALAVHEAEAFALFTEPTTQIGVADVVRMNADSGEGAVVSSAMSGPLAITTDADGFVMVTAFFDVLSGTTGFALDHTPFGTSGFDRSEHVEVPGAVLAATGGLAGVAVLTSTELDDGVHALLVRRKGAQ